MILSPLSPKSWRRTALGAAALGLCFGGALAADPARDEAWEHAFPTMAALVASLSAPPPSPAAVMAEDAPPRPSDPSASQELGRFLHEVMVELYGRAVDEELPTTTTRGAGTPCTLDGRAFRQPFMDAVVTGPSFAAWEQPVDAAWLEPRSGLGERVPLSPQADPIWGWRAELPALKPGSWVVVLQPSRGGATCVRVEVPDGPPPPAGCPSSGDDRALCELVVALSARRYGEVLGMVQGLPDSSELSRLAVLGACAFGHRPGDLAPGTGLSCRDVMKSR